MNREYEKSRRIFEKTVQFSSRFKPPSLVASSQLCLANQRVLGGRDINISELLDWFYKIRAINSQRSAANTIGEIFLNIDDQHVSEAEEWINKTIEINTQNRTTFLLGQGYRLYSDFFKRQDNLPQAREQMTKAINIMKECGADGCVERNEKELAELF